jgi:hypothetical protein
MKSSKFFGVVSIAAFLLLSFSSCKKDKESIPANSLTKSQLLGKWSMDVILSGGTVEKDQVNLKADGTMEMDIEPHDGITDFILSWDLKDNVFSAHLDLNGVSNAWKLNAHVDPETMLIAGEKTMVGGGNNSITLIFGMKKL